MLYIQNVCTEGIYFTTGCCLATRTNEIQDKKNYYIKKNLIRNLRKLSSQHQNGFKINGKREI